MRDRGRLLVWGPRRMGKSSVIGVAAQRLRREGGIVVVTDLATATSLADAAERLLRAVSRVTRWRERMVAWAKSLGPVVTLGWDEAGRPRLSLGVETRPRGPEAERDLLERVLDQIETVAASEERPVVVVLDEFQRLSELDGEPAEWLLRNRMQEHRHTGYVCAGSKEHLVRELLQPQRAFFKFFDVLHVGPMDPDHMATWIDHRLTRAGVAASGIGAAIVARVGPRTQDVVQTARAVWFASVMRGKAGASDVASAVQEIVAGEDTALRRIWEDLSKMQQRVLRTLASGAEQLHSTATRTAHGLGASSSVATAVDALTARSILERVNGDVRFDNPFFRIWIEQHVLAA
jgi:AAA ATPase domain